MCQCYFIPPSKLLLQMVSMPALPHKKTPLTKKRTKEKKKDNFNSHPYIVLLALFLSRSSSLKACCCGSVAQSCLTLCNPMDCSAPGSSVLRRLPEFAQLHPLSQWCYLTTSSSATLFSQSSSVRIQMVRIWNLTCAMSSWASWQMDATDLIIPVNRWGNRGWHSPCCTTNNSPEERTQINSDKLNELSPDPKRGPQALSSCSAH